MALPYVFTAHAMFPEPDAAADGDTHFHDQQPILLGMLMVPLGLSLAFNLVGHVLAGANPFATATDVVSFMLAWVAPLVTLGAMIPLRARRWSVAGLLLLIADRLVLLFLV
jgi:hypothetical protein